MIPLFTVNMSSKVQDFVLPTLNSGYIGEGPKVIEFEKAFSELVEARAQVVTVNSCTAAVDLALQLIGIGPGDSVITSPMSCYATYPGITRRGASILWADINPQTGLIDPEDVARKVQPNTKAIIAIDWAGASCQYDLIRAALPRPVPIIQDAAHSMLTRYQETSIAANNQWIANSPAGGDYVAWSFGPIKHLTTGDGGALLCPPDQRKRATLLRWYGLDRTSTKDFRCSQSITEPNGFKYHMNDINASIGLANLEHIKEVVAAHRDNADAYNNYLNDIPGIINSKPNPESAWWLYTLIVPGRRDEFIKFLSDRHIAASPVHRRADEHPVFAQFRTRLPGVDYFAANEVAIPVHNKVSIKDRNYIIDVIREWK